MVSVHRMMLGMSRFPVPMVCHAILRIDLVPAQVRELEATIRRRCRDSDAQLVDFCVDLGTPKRRPEEYPAHSYFRAGKADALLIVCVPSDELPPRGDLLTSLALSGFPGAWLAVPKLREVGMLPAAIGLRSVATQRAAALRERRFSCDVIARRLDAEGYAAPNTEPGQLDPQRRADAPARSPQCSASAAARRAAGCSGCVVGGNLRPRSVACLRWCPSRGDL